MPTLGQDKFVTINGLQLHYVEWGSTGKPSIVLLHGFQNNAHTWDTFSSAMATDYHVLALEQRGHGDSAWAPDGNYAPEAFASDAAAFIEALNLAPTLLIGHSMGGRYAALVTAEHPDKVAKLVMVDTPAELPPNIESLLAQQPDRDNLPEPETFDAFEDIIAKATSEYPLTPEAELRRANYHNLYHGADGKWHWKWDLNLIERECISRILKMDDLYDVFPRVQCPALLFRGAESPLLTAEVAQKMIERLPNGRLEEIANAAHTVNADQAEAFQTITASFLAA
ncbi:alpha/beta fold hydrolase [Candidatus Entotheonella palauensis]|uniref:alpha/beta fold hydrolase n=1 Tax=Candidatus Entotheonella palauensis TaxID=93172 RepID=UPI000B7E3BB0|nr:alpha/beta hydrolase [Candidatus Entotheonella palauensis]